MVDPGPPPRGPGRLSRRRRGSNSLATRDSCPAWPPERPGKGLWPRREDWGRVARGCSGPCPAALSATTRVDLSRYARLVPGLAAREARQGALAGTSWPVTARGKLPGTFPGGSLGEDAGRSLSLRETCARPGRPRGQARGSGRGERTGDESREAARGLARRLSRRRCGSISLATRDLCPAWPPERPGKGLWPRREDWGRVARGCSGQTRAAVQATFPVLSPRKARKFSRRFAAQRRRKVSHGPADPS